jgi:adenylate cyclase 1
MKLLPSTQSSLLSDKLKRPFKKRHSSLPHTPSSRVNKYLAQAIEARSVNREQATHVSLVTLCFRDTTKERQVRHCSSRRHSLI